MNWQSRPSGQSDENPPCFVGIAVVSFAPYAAFLFSWDYASLLLIKAIYCLGSESALGALRNWRSLSRRVHSVPAAQDSSPFVSDFTVFVVLIFCWVSAPPHTHTSFSCISICLQRAAYSVLMAAVQRRWSCSATS